MPFVEGLLVSSERAEGAERSCMLVISQLPCPVMMPFLPVQVGPNQESGPSPRRSLATSYYFAGLGPYLQVLQRKWQHKARGYIRFMDELGGGEGNLGEVGDRCNVSLLFSTTLGFENFRQWHLGWQATGVRFGSTGGPCRLPGRLEVRGAQSGGAAVGCGGWGIRRFES